MHRIDLHTHSHCSDGSLSPQALVEAAHAAGVTLLALTDHDSVAGNAAAAQRAAELGMGFWPGVELSVHWPRPAGPGAAAPGGRAVVIHVVGLQVQAHPVLEALLCRQQQARGRRGQQICARLQQRLGADPWPEVLAAAQQQPEAVSRTHIAQWLHRQGHVRSVQQAFDRWLGTGKPAHVQPDWCTLAEGIAAIRQAGGRAVLAHPTRYGLSATHTRLLVAAFAGAGGDALELPDLQVPVASRDMVARLCVQHGLQASVGSDFHGPHLHWRRLGQVPPLPAGLQLLGH
jgi:hypothetical protein